jgi:hypothetical protein
MPSPRLERALALAVTLALTVPPVRGGEAIRVLVQSSPLAGSQYYAASALWSQIRTGDRLTLVREADNRHDRNAVRVDWNGQQLGYVPRAENRAVARALDAGERLEARVSRMRQDPDPWRRLEFEVFLLL